MNKYNYKLETLTNENAISYYLLGAWMTDGCIYHYKNRPNKKSVTLTSKDKDWLETINKYICPKKQILQHGKNCYRLMYNSTKLGEWFISKGCVPKKSLILRFPVIPDEYIPDFIRGCWDGDGSLSFTKSGNKGKNFQRQANFTSGSLLFCQELSKQLFKYGIKNNVILHSAKERKIENRILQPSKNYRVIITSGESVYIMCKLLYHNSTIFMSRKYNIAHQIIDNWELPSFCNECGITIKLKTRAGRRPKNCKTCTKILYNSRQRKKYNNKKHL